MKGGFEALGRVRAQAMVLLVLAFLAGAFAGVALERVAFRPVRGERIGWRGGRGGPGGPGSPERGGVRGGLPAFYERLSLTDSQKTKIEEILKKRRPRVDSLMQSTWAVIGAASDSTRKEIDAVLTADQRRKLDSLRPSRGRGFGLPGSRGGPRGGGGGGEREGRPPGGGGAPPRGPGSR
ncbi:MAG TPA: hypothetical protein VJL28_04895 [Gemmatimonadaceae bacterium]|nr:hypothetical protein [Gemmatimonadaceae bacterium]